MEKYFLTVLSLFFILNFSSFTFAQTLAVIPEAPIIVTAVASDGQAIVYFTPPKEKDVDDLTVEAYRVVSIPGSYKATGSGSPITVTGLTNGVSYTFIITAINPSGSSIPSTSSLPIIPTPPVDVCSNISGVQISIPVGMHLEDLSDCVLNPPTKRKVVEVPLVVPITNIDATSSVSNSSSSVSVNKVVDIDSSSSTINIDQDVSKPEEDNVSVTNSVVNVVGNLAKIAQEKTSEVAQVTQTIVINTKDYVNTPTGGAVTKTITTVGIFGSGLAAVSASFASPFTAPEMLLIPMRLWGLIMTVFSLKRKNRSWGTVYDSVTKQPIDPAYVSLKDLSGKEISSSITDLDGRYGFLVGPGKYILEAKKTNYSYPSTRLLGKLSDEMYNNLYFGGEIEVLEGGLVINKNIPLDPLRFDWNEFAKGKNKLMSFYSKRELILKKISDVLFEIGFIIGILALLFAPEPYNFGIVLLYLITLALKVFGIKTKTSGSILNMIDGSPLSFAIVKVFSEDWNAEITKKVADKYGKYYCLLPVGKYHVVINKKNDDGTYSEIYKSPVLDIQNGVLNKNFSV
jgi:hypothetical protein